MKQAVSKGIISDEKLSRTFDDRSLFDDVVVDGG